MADLVAVLIMAAGNDYLPAVSFVGGFKSPKKDALSATWEAYLSIRARVQYHSRCLRLRRLMTSPPRPSRATHTCLLPPHSQLAPLWEAERVMCSTIRCTQCRGHT